jgi:hypothetical protein
VRWWILRQTTLVVGAIGAYFGARGLTEGSADLAIQHARVLVEWEQRLGIHVEATLADPVASSPVLATLANWVYIWGHWPVIVATMVWSAVWHPAVFVRLRDGMLVSGLLGVVVFVAYPVAPPRLAGLGLTDTVSERSESYRVLQPPAFVNQYAAMPSLHVGWDLLVGIAIVTGTSSLALRAFGIAMPAVMAATVVVTANHYVLDVVAGILLVLVGHLTALAWERRGSHLSRGAQQVVHRGRAERTLR